MIDEQFEAMVERAARRGAEEALRSVGLHDGDAVRDVRELRDLLLSWRLVKRSVIATAAKVGTAAVLALLAAGFWLRIGGGEK